MSTERTGISRRALLPATAAAITILPRHILGRGYQAPSDKLNIAAVGVGGMGKNYVAGCKSENIVAIADVDETLAAPVLKDYPRAKPYRDYRVMLEREKGIDAVIIGTPDHSHAMITMAAIGLHKHVYVAKPMTRTIREVRTVAKAARQAGIATQMSVQSCSSDPAVTTEEWIKAGVVGPVREVHVWSDRPMWPQAIARPAEVYPVPPTLDWDIWLGPAPARPFNPLYHPFNFRGWYDFGTGALGDMACHTLHVIIKSLSLGAPTAVEASVAFLRIPLQPGETAEPDWSRSRRAVYPETFPAASMITWDFPARGDQPPVRVHWYDGGIRPPRPIGLAPDRSLEKEKDGILFVGDKGTIHSGFYGGPKFLSDEQQRTITPPPKTLPRTKDHYQEWIAAAKGGKPAACNFEFAVPLTEIALLGVIAQRTGTYLCWDAANMTFTNDRAANQFLESPYRAGWSL